MSVTMFCFVFFFLTAVSNFAEFTLQHLFYEHENRSDRSLFSNLGEVYKPVHNCEHVNSPLDSVGFYCVFHWLSNF